MSECVCLQIFLKLDIEYSSLKALTIFSVLQLICCSDYTELESMRLSLEAPGLLLAGHHDTLQPPRQAAKLLNINTTQVHTGHILHAVASQVLAPVTY